MLVHETGTCSGSDLYFSTPSEYARRMLFYMSTCGYYYTNYDCAKCAGCGPIEARTVRPVYSTSSRRPNWMEK